MAMQTTTEGSAVYNSEMSASGSNARAGPIFSGSVRKTQAAATPSASRCTTRAPREALTTLQRIIGTVVANRSPATRISDSRVRRSALFAVSSMSTSLVRPDPSIAAQYYLCTCAPVGPALTVMAQTGEATKTHEIAACRWRQAQFSQARAGASRWRRAECGPGRDAHRPALRRRDVPVVLRVAGHPGARRHPRRRLGFACTADRAHARAHGAGVAGASS